MKKHIQTGLALGFLAFGILGLIAPQVGLAQGNSAGPTMYQAEQGESAGGAQAGQGQTYQTMTQGANSNSGLNLPKVQTGVLAPESVNQAPIPSGQYTFGFPGGQGQAYRGPYKGGGGSSGGGGFSVGTNLPPTSTSSCLPITILDDEKGVPAGGPVYGNSMGGGGGGGGGSGGGGGGSGGGGGGGGGNSLGPSGGGSPF